MGLNALYCLPDGTQQVVYFRANVAGACDYVNDSRYWRYSHGTCWSELAEDLTVIDVPGDHFSLLRQVNLTWHGAEFNS